jgi:hypothetical protein
VNILRITIIALSCLLAFILAGGTLFSMAAMISLPAGPRPGIREESMESSGLSGWGLVREATNHVDERFEYCRRNNLQHFQRAYERRLGFCQQQAFALNEILNRLGFETRPVQSVRCRFADGRIGGHAWVEVRHMRETKYVDTLLQDPGTATLTFEPIARVTGF